MEAPVPGRPFLGIGREDTRPSGPEDYQLKKAMLREARAKTFRFRVNLWCWIRDLWSCLWGQGRWSWLTELGRFDWDGFETRLEESEFLCFRNILGEHRRRLGRPWDQRKMALRSCGMSGCTT